MGMAGFCARGRHADCPDSRNDQYVCDCPCHLIADTVDAILDEPPTDPADAPTDPDGA